MCVYGTIGVIDDARRENRRRRLRSWHLHPERERVQRLILLIDRMVDELEVLNLRGAERVGREWRCRLAGLFSDLPFPYLPRLRAYPSPTEVLDLLFDLQAPLLSMKQSQASAARAATRQEWLSGARRAD
jgi:hypothetical protein